MQADIIMSMYSVRKMNIAGNLKNFIRFCYRYITCLLQWLLYVSQGTRLLQSKKPVPGAYALFTGFSYLSAIMLLLCFVLLHRLGRHFYLHTADFLTHHGVGFLVFQIQIIHIPKITAS